MAYNREILGLSPRLARYRFGRKEGRVRFSFRDAQHNTPIVAGNVGEAKQPSIGATMALCRTFGLIGAIRAARTKVIELKVVNPISAVLSRNADALTVSSSDAIVAQLFDPKQDRLEISDECYGGLDFRAEFVEHMLGFKLVCLTPQAHHASAP